MGCCEGKVCRVAVSGVEFVELVVVNAEVNVKFFHSLKVVRWWGGGGVRFVGEVVMG